MTDLNAISGGCHCGAVRYAATTSPSFDHLLLRAMPEDHRHRPCASIRAGKSNGDAEREAGALRIQGEQR
jgi:hypothetical protein